MDQAVYYHFGQLEIIHVTLVRIFHPPLVHQTILLILLRKCLISVLR